MNINVLVDLVEQKEKGLITPEEFERKKTELLNNYSYGRPNDEQSEWSYFIECITKKYATFRGRARRKEYWSFVLFSMLFGFLFGLILGVLEFIIGSPVFTIIGQLIWSLIIIIPSYAVLVRRLHDVGRSGWLSLLPLGGGLIFTLVLIGFALSGLFVDNSKLYILFISMGVFAVYELVVGIVLFIFTISMTELKENKYGPVPKGICY